MRISYGVTGRWSLCSETGILNATAQLRLWFLYFNFFFQPNGGSLQTVIAVQLRDGGGGATSKEEPSWRLEIRGSVATTYVHDGLIPTRQIAMQPLTAFVHGIL